MVTGPGPRVRGALSSSAELLHLNGSRMCSLPNLPEYRNGHTQTGLLTCGGGGEAKKSCITFTGGEWKKRHTLMGKKGRYEHEAWASPQGVLLMGGYYSMDTTELLKPDGTTESSFKLKHGRR